MTRLTLTINKLIQSKLPNEHYTIDTEIHLLGYGWPDGNVISLCSPAPSETIHVNR